MDRLRRAAIWTLAIELPLAASAVLSTVPALYGTLPLVLTAHLPGIFLLESLHMCCGIGGGSVISDVGPLFVEPPVLVNIGILALANAVMIFLVAWAVVLVRGWLRSGATAAHS